MTAHRTVHQALGELQAALAELTQPRKRKVLRAGGGTTSHMAPSLLDELRRAIGTSGESGGGGRGSRTPIPVDPPALDLLRKISVDVDHLHQAALTASGLALEEHLRQIGHLATGWASVDTIDWATGWLRHWVGQITGLLDPEQRRSIDAPCPLCGARMASRHDAGETVQVPALLVDARHGADCQACHAHWPPEMLRQLASLIEQQNTPEGSDL